MANDTKDKYSVSYRSGRTVDKKKKKKKEMTESEKMPHGMYETIRKATRTVEKVYYPKQKKYKSRAYIANSLDSYKKAFRSMRNKYGDNAKFEWRGKTYTTKLKKENKYERLGKRFRELPEEIK